MSQFSTNKPLREVTLERKRCRRTVVESDTKPIVVHTVPKNSELGIIANNINENSSLTKNKIVKEKSNKSVVRKKPYEKKFTENSSTYKVQDFIQISNDLNKIIETVSKQISDSTKRKREKSVKHNVVKTRTKRKKVDLEHGLTVNSETVCKNGIDILNSNVNKCNLIQDSNSSTERCVTTSGNSVHVINTPPEEICQPTSNLQLSATNNSAISQNVEKIRSVPTLQQDEVNINRSQNVSLVANSQKVSNVSSSNNLCDNTLRNVLGTTNFISNLVPLIHTYFKEDIQTSGNSVHVINTPPEEICQPTSNVQLSATNNSAISQNVEKIRSVPTLQQDEVNISRSQNVSLVANSQKVSNVSSSNNLCDNTLRNVLGTTNFISNLVPLIHTYFKEDIQRKLEVMKCLYIEVYNNTIKLRFVMDSILKSSPSTEERAKKIKENENYFYKIVKGPCGEFIKLFNEVVSSFGLNIRYELLLLLYCIIVCMIFKESRGTLVHFFTGKQMFTFMFQRMNYNSELLRILFALKEDVFSDLVRSACKAISEVFPRLPPESKFLQEICEKNLKVSKELVEFNAAANENLNRGNIVIQDPHINYAGSNANTSNNSADLNINIQLRHSVVNDPSSPCFTVTSNKSCEINNCFSVGRCCCFNENQHINKNIAKYNQNQNLIDFNNANYNSPVLTTQPPPPRPTDQTCLPQHPVKDVPYSGMNYYHQNKSDMMKNYSNQNNSMLKDMLRAGSNTQGVMYPQYQNTSAHNIQTKGTYTPSFPKQVSVPSSTEPNHHNVMMLNKNRKMLVNSSQQTHPMQNYNTSISQTLIPVNQNLPESSNIQFLQQLDNMQQKHADYSNSNLSNAKKVNSTIKQNEGSKVHPQERKRRVSTNRKNRIQVQARGPLNKDNTINQFVKGMNYDKLHLNLVNNEILNQDRPVNAQNGDKTFKETITVSEVAAKVNQDRLENLQSGGKFICMAVKCDQCSRNNNNNTGSTIVGSTSAITQSSNANIQSNQSIDNISQLSPYEKSVSEKQSVPSSNFNSACRLKVKDPETLNGSVVEINPEFQSRNNRIHGVYIIESNDLETPDEPSTDPLANDNDVSIIGNNSVSSVQQSFVSYSNVNSSAISGGIGVAYNPPMSLTTTSHMIQPGIQQNNPFVRNTGTLIRNNSSVQQSPVSNSEINSSSIGGDIETTYSRSPLINNTNTSHTVQRTIQNNVFVSNTGSFIGNNSLSVKPVKDGTDCCSNNDNSTKTLRNLNEHTGLATITLVPVPQIPDPSVLEKDNSPSSSMMTCSKSFSNSSLNTTASSAASCSGISNSSVDEGYKRVNINSSAKGNRLNAVSADATISSNLTQGNNETDVEDLRCSFEDCTKTATVLCSGCHQMQYCSQECQEKHWYRSHLNTCTSADQMT